MKAVLVICSHCWARQLADVKMMGGVVSCAQCGTSFRCEAGSEPLSWVRTVLNKGSEAKFVKYVSRILFSYGVAVPVAQQDMIVEHLGDGVSEGSDNPVRVEVQGTIYPANLNLFKNKKGEPALHFKWRKGTGIETALGRLFPEAYEHSVVLGKKDFFPGAVVEMGPALEAGVFWLRRQVEVVNQGSDKGKQGHEQMASTRESPQGLSEVLGE